MYILSMRRGSHSSNRSTQPAHHRICIDSHKQDMYVVSKHCMQFQRATLQFADGVFASAVHTTQKSDVVQVSLRHFVSWRSSEIAIRSLHYVYREDLTKT